MQDLFEKELDEGTPGEKLQHHAPQARFQKSEDMMDQLKPATSSILEFETKTIPNDPKFTTPTTLVELSSAKPALLTPAGITSDQSTIHHLMNPFDANEAK